MWTSSSLNVTNSLWPPTPQLTQVRSVHECLLNTTKSWRPFGALHSHMLIVWFSLGGFSSACVSFASRSWRSYRIIKYLCHVLSPTWGCSLNRGSPRACKACILALFPADNCSAAISANNKTSLKSAISQRVFCYSSSAYLRIWDSLFYLISGLGMGVLLAGDASAFCFEE